MTDHNKQCQSPECSDARAMAEHYYDLLCDEINRRYEANDSKHCVDCCCARIWSVLQIDKQNGMDIVDNVSSVLKERDDALRSIERLGALDGQAALEERDEQIRQLKKNVELLAGSLRGTLNAMGSHGPCCCTTAYDLGVKALTTAGVGR